MTKWLLLSQMVWIASCAATPTPADSEPWPAAPATKTPPPPDAVDRSNGLSLEEAIAVAMAQNPRLVTVRRQLGVAGAERVTARQYPFNPVLSVEGDRSFGSSGDYTAELGISQEFEIGGQRGRRVDVATANYQRTRAEIANAERIVRAEVASSFLRNLFLDALVSLADRNVQIARDVLAAAEARFQAKQIPGSNVNLVRIQYQQTRNARERAGARRRAARLRMATLLGEKSASDLVLVGDLRAAVPETERKRALEAAHHNRPDLAALRHAVEAAAKEVELEKALAVPNPEVGLFLGREKLSIETLTDRDDFAGIEFRIPIPVFNKRQGEIAAARARYRVGVAAVQALTRQIEQEVDLALNGLAVARETVRIYEQQLNQLSRATLDSFERAYRAGEVGTLEVLRAQEDYNRTAEGYQEALLGLNISRVELEAAIAERVTESARNERTE